MAWNINWYNIQNSCYEIFGFSANSIIADVGSGTGKFARQMIERGSYVYCVELNGDMRNQAIIELGNYKNCNIIAGYVK